MLARSVLFFVVAGLMEIGGGYLMWLWLRERWAWWVGALGALVLVGYGVVPTLQPANFGRVYAAYGGVFIAMSMLWGWWVDGQRPDRWDVTGAALCLAGVAVIMYTPRVGKEWKYLYRAVDSSGDTIEFMLSAKHDVSAAKRFFRKMMGADHRGLPFTIGTDKHASYPEAFAVSVKEKVLPPDCKLRRVKYLNNIIEQDHRAMRRRWRAMQCFRSIHTAERTIEGIEASHMMRKGQVKRLDGRDAIGQASWSRACSGSLPK